MPQSDLTRSVTGANFISPVINGAMHIPPAIAATQVALGRDQPLDTSILLMLFALHVLIDGKYSLLSILSSHFKFAEADNMTVVLDKDADLPSETRKEWRNSIAVFASLFIGLVGYGTWHCGIMALVRLLAVPMLAIVHAIPLIPVYSWKDGRFSLVKLKYFLGPFKSIFGATCIGLMDTTSVVLYLCGSRDCQTEAFHAGELQVLAYTVLYDFLWESIADVRDLEEDTHNNVTTLATTFGVSRTLWILAASTVIGDVFITGVGGRDTVTWTSISRPLFFWGALTLLVLDKPRSAVISWGVGTLVALLPVWLASRSE
jgi:hypothetical protein